MGRDDDERSIDDGWPGDEGRPLDDETIVISDGRHAAPPAAPGESSNDAAVDRPAAVDDPAGSRGPVGDDGQAHDPATGAAQERPALDPPPPSPDAERQQVSLPPGPALVAVGLGLLTKNGWVFQDINLTLRQSSVAAIVGPAGSGRTSLLLALVGRMEANTGSLTIAGHSLQDRPRNIRMVTSVARAGRLTFPEPGLTVSESVAERCLIEDENVLAGRSRFEEACAALRLEIDPTTLVGRLAGEQATLLAVALACVRVSAVIVLDDLDRDVSAATQQRMVDALLRLAKAMGPTIIVTTTDRIPVMDADVVLDLTPMDGAAIWELDPRNAETALIARQLSGYAGSEWAPQLPVVDADPNGPPGSEDADGYGPGDQGAGDQAPGDQAQGDQGGGGPRPGARPSGDDLTGSDLADGQHGGAQGPDYDGRWSRERWEAGAGADQPGLDHPGLDQPGPDQPGAVHTGPDQPPVAGPDPTYPADPHGTRTTDRGGDATNAPGPTEDPR
jgi:ABC-type Mn2+/Zn2+ transport system ATPase subunit